MFIILGLLGWKNVWIIWQSFRNRWYKPEHMDGNYFTCYVRIKVGTNFFQKRANFNKILSDIHMWYEMNAWMVHL